MTESRRPGDIHRRDFVRHAALGAAGVGVISSCGGGGANPEAATGQIASGPEVNWILQSSYPPSLDLLHGGSIHLAERVSQLTGGRFNIRVFSGGEIVPALSVMDGVQSGTLQAGHTASYYYIGKHPALAFDAGVPFGLDTRQRLAWMYHGGGRDLLNELFAQFNIISFPLGSTGAQMGGWFREPIETMADLRGVTMRIPGLGGEIMSRLGATVQNLAGGDIYPALERGAIDATEWVGPYDDEKLGFHEIAKNYYYPGWWEPGVTSSLHVGLDAWNELPPQYQAVLETVTYETTNWMVSNYDAKNPAALERLVGEHGVQLRPFSQEILEAAWQESRATLQEQAAADAEFRRIYESWDAFRSGVFGYFAGNELAYASFTFPRG